MKVFLDTGPFHDNIHVEGEHFVLLADAIAEGTVEAAIPEVVVGEVVTQYRKRLEKANSALTSQARVKQLVGAFDLPELPDPEYEADQFETKFRQRLDDIGIEVLAIPNLAHADMLSRDQRNRKPFTEGRGYRDALIWESILAETRSAPADFIVVSVNTRDFGGSADGSIHSDLVEDLNTIDPNIKGQLRTKLKDFIDREIKPRLRSVEELKRALRERTYRNFTIDELVADHLDDLVNTSASGLHLTVTTVDLDEPITIESASGIEDIEVVDVLEMNSGLIYVEGTARCTATIEGYVFKSDAYGLEEEGRIHVTNWHWNEHYAEVEIPDIPVKVTFSFTFNRTTGELHKFEFLNAEGA